MHPVCDKGQKTPQEPFSNPCSSNAGSLQGPPGPEGILSSHRFLSGTQGKEYLVDICKQQNLPPYTPAVAGSCTLRLAAQGGGRQSLGMRAGVLSGPADHKPGGAGHSEEAPEGGVHPVEGNWLRAQGRGTEIRAGDT